MAANGFREHKSYQFEWFDNCERNRKDLVRTKPVEETVKGAGNSIRRTLLLTITPVAARSFAEVLDAPDDASAT